MAVITHEPVGWPPPPIPLRDHPAIDGGEQFTLQPGLATMLAAIEFRHRAHFSFVVQPPNAGDNRRARMVEDDSGADCESGSSPC